MSTSLTCLRVFIASPGGLGDERRAFRDEISEYNDAEAIPRGVVFQAVSWEDTLGAIGRPQSIINEDVRKSDYFVLLLWDRWGSPPDPNSGSGLSSGTEEEHRVALECYKDAEQPMTQLVLMFKGSIDPQQLSDPGPQLTKVLDFKKGIENTKSHLYETFDTTESFRTLLRRHLADWRRDREHCPDGVRVEPIHPQPITPVERIGGPPDLYSTGQREYPKESLLANAWSLANQGRLTEAEVEFARAIVGRRRPEALVDYGRFLYRVGRLDQATVLFEGAVQLADEQGDVQALSGAYGNLGKVLHVRGDLDGAEEMYRKSLEIDEKLGRLEGMASAYGNLGIVLQVRGDLDGAEEMHRKCLEINDNMGWLEGMAGAYGNLGNVLQVRGDLDGAEEMYRKSLEIDEKLGRLEDMASAYGNLGVVLSVRGDLDGAEEMHRKSLEINEKLGWLEGMANAYGNLGIELQVRGDLDGAEEMYLKSLEINEKLGRLEGMASVYGNLGNVLQVRGNLNGAAEMYLKSLEIDEKLGRLEGMASAYGNLGNVLQDRGNLDGAEEMHRKSLEINEKLGRLEGMANAYGSLGNVLQDRGNLDGAEEMYRQALGLAENLGASALIAQITSLLQDLGEST